MKETEHPNDLSQDLNVICDDGFHRIILRLQAVMTIFLIKSLYGSGIIQKSDNDLTVFRGAFLLDQKMIPTENPCAFIMLSPLL